MNETEIEQLLDTLDSVSAKEFWWDSPLLAAASKAHEPRVVCALALRHHGLGNKDAYSAHVVRHAIRACDGPQFPTLWSVIDAENNPTTIQEHMDDFRYLPWAAAFIIGESGGAPAFHQTVSRLTPTHSQRHFLLVRLFSHILIRYLKIDAEEEPEVNMIDLNTGKSEPLLSRYVSRPNFDMTKRKRAEANELFTALPPSAVQEANRRIEQIPDRFFNMPKEQFRIALSRLPIAETPPIRSAPPASPILQPKPQESKRSLFGFLRKQKPQNALDEFIFAVYGNPPPAKRASLEQAITLANELLTGVVPHQEVRSQAVALEGGPIPYSTHDLALSVALNFFKQPEYIPQLFSAQLLARMKALQWLKDGLAVGPLVKSFEEVLYTRYQPSH